MKREVKSKKPLIPIEQSFRQLEDSRKPLPALPFDQTTHWTETFEAPVQSSKKQRPARTFGNLESNMMCSSSDQQLPSPLSEKVKLRESNLVPSSEVKASDEQVPRAPNPCSPSAKHRRRFSIATFHSSEGKQSTDTRSSTSLLDFAFLPKRSATIITASHRKASFIQIGTRRFGPTGTKEKGPTPRNYSAFSRTSDRHNSVKARTIGKKHQLATVEDKIASMDEGPTQKSTIQNANNNICGGVAYRLISMFKKNQSKRFPFPGRPSARHPTSGQLYVEDDRREGLYDLGEISSSKTLQSVGEALRTGPQIPKTSKRPRLKEPPMIQTYDFISDEVLEEAPTSSPLCPQNYSSRCQTPSSDHLLPSKVDRETTKNPRSSPLHLERETLTLSGSSTSSARYSIISPTSPFATVKHRGRFQKGVEPTDGYANLSSPLLSVNQNSLSSSPAGSIRITQLRPRAATNPCNWHGPETAKTVAESLQLGREFVPYLRSERPKSKTWAHGTRSGHLRSSVLPQKACQEEGEKSPFSKTLEKTKHPTFSGSDSTPSSQASDPSTISETQIPTVGSSVDLYRAPITHRVIRVSPFINISKAPDHSSSTGSRAPFLTYEALARHIATLDLGPPPPIPPRHPARTAETFESPTAKPRRCHTRFTSVDSNGQSCNVQSRDVDSIRTTAAHHALTSPVPSPTYIEIELLPSSPRRSLSSSSLVMRSELLDGSFLKRNSSTHSISGHPLGGTTSKASNRLSRMSSELRSEYTSVIDSMMIELEEMQNAFTHRKNRSKDTCSSNWTTTNHDEAAETVKTEGAGETCRWKNSFNNTCNSGIADEHEQACESHPKTLENTFSEDRSSPRPFKPKPKAEPEPEPEPEATTMRNTENGTIRRAWSPYPPIEANATVKAKATRHLPKMAVGSGGCERASRTERAVKAEAEAEAETEGGGANGNKHAWRGRTKRRR